MTARSKDRPWWPVFPLVLLIAMVLLELAIVWGAMYLHGDCEFTPLYKSAWCAL